MTRNGLPERVELASQVTVRLGPERGFLFHQRTGRIYSLSGTAALATARMAEGCSVDQVVDAVLDAFDADGGAVREGLQTLIDDLVREGLATVHG
ncbi:MAG: hypothetical protein A3F92_03535 [Candidatus Rokubacteria bacterium RIFCSPLOWO2_12_FULL_71_22]|nr:MAG: hypothetical protein A3F92_03535 [Candidatus Rokubacteria bacterium RIFCSPLOWO2_12_FULL_71_22]